MPNENFSSDSKVEVFLRESPLTLATECESWLQSIKAKISRRILESLATNTDDLDRYIEFAEIREVPGAFVACSFYQRDINDALTRAGLYMGAGKGLKAKTVVSQNDFALLNYKKLVAGHNLPGPILSEFFQAIQSSEDPNIAANAAEAAVFKSFLSSNRIASLNSAFYLIGFSIQTMKDQKGVISHELLHASSFLKKDYRDIVTKFWREEVSSEDKQAITREIGLAYNTDDEDLVIDEFQAYLVQSNAEADRMKAFVPKYRAMLLNRLSAANIELITL